MTESGHDGPGRRDVKMQYSLTQFDTLVYIGTDIIEIKGSGGDCIEIGQTYRLAGESEDFTGTKLKPGDQAEILGFRAPGEHGITDDIVQVRVNENEEWVKPSRIGQKIN